MFAPTFVGNAVAFLFLVAQVMGLDLPYAPEEVEAALTLLGVIAAQLFTLYRQWYTGRATLSGLRPK